MLRKIRKALRNFRDSQPFTLRGLIALAAGFIAIDFFGASESDLVASMLGAAILCLVILSLIGTLAQSIRLKRRLTAITKLDPTLNISRAPIGSVISLANANCLPFFSLKVERRFHAEQVDSPVHIVSGSAEDSHTTLADRIIFPHRGFWKLESLHLTTGDQLGLTARSWETPLEETFDIQPPKVSIRPLPLVAASARTGDEINVSRERSGDPFDIKAYDPSDGVTRILWKTYARSGELVVRRPEPAMIPEGEMAIYLVAKKNDDHVAASFLSYLAQLRDRNITVLFGTDGLIDLNDQLNIQAPQQFCTTDEEIHSAISHSVWSRQAGSGKGFTAFLDSLERTQRFFSQVIVFGPAEGGWVDEILHASSVRSIRVAIAIAPSEVLPELFEPSSNSSERKRASSAEAARSLRAVSLSVERGGGEFFICENAELAFQSAA